MYFDGKQLLELAFDYTLSGLALLTPEFTFIRVNKAYAQADQREVSDFPGRNHFDLYPSAENRAIFEEVVRSKEPYCAVARPFEYADHPERGVTYWDWTLVPVLAGNGDVECLLFSLNDVTGRVRTQESLLKSEERSQAMLNAIPDMMFRMDSQGVFLDYRAETGDLYHQSDTGIIGKRCRDTMPPELVEVIEQNIAQTLATSATITFEYQLDLPLRGRREYEARMVPCGTAEVLTIVRDITDRRYSEAERDETLALLRTVVNTAPMRIFWKDRNCRYLGCNRLFAQDAGKTEPDELLGRDDYDMGWASQAGSYQADDRQVMESGKAKLNYVEPQTTPDGRTIHLRTSKVPLCDKYGETIGVLGIYDDISESMDIQKKLEESEQRLRLAMGAANMGVWEYNFADSSLYWSPELTEIFGMQGAEPSRSLLESMEHEADRGTSDAAMKKAIATRTPYHVVYRIVINGITKWVEDFATIRYLENGLPECAIGLARDITEQKLATEKLHAQFSELRRWQEVMLNREERIIQLKAEVNGLLARLKEAPRYGNAPVTGGQI